MEFWLSLKVLFGRGFDVIHACNPPDTIFLIGGFYKLFGKKFVFDHHDINPELYEAKFGKRGFGHKLLAGARAPDVPHRRHGDLHQRVVSPHRADARRHEPARRVRGALRPGPDAHEAGAGRIPALKHGRRYLVGYVGVMGKQEGIDLLLQAVQLIVHAPRAHRHPLRAGGRRHRARRPCASSRRISASPTT